MLATHQNDKTGTVNFDEIRLRYRVTIRFIFTAIDVGIVPIGYMTLCALDCSRIVLLLCSCLVLFKTGLIN